MIAKRMLLQEAIGWVLQRREVLIIPVDAIWLTMLYISTFIDISETDIMMRHQSAQI